MGLSKTTVVPTTMLSPFGKACARMDLTAVHDILLKTGYKDEEGAENEVSQRLILSLKVIFIMEDLFETIWCSYFRLPLLDKMFVFASG